MPINPDNSEMKWRSILLYRPYWIIWIKNTNDRHVGGIELKDARRPIESPVRFLSDCTCEILAGYHAPGAGWYWNPHTAAINIPIYFWLIFFLTTLKNKSKYFFKKRWAAKGFEPQTYWSWAKPPNQYTSEGVVPKHRFLSWMNLFTE